MNILLIGKPASGKGTITKKLESDGFIQLSTGDILRAEVATGSDLGKKIDDLLKQGQFATDEMIFKIVDDFLLKNAGKSIIFDGFPRNLKQAQSCLERGIVFDKIFELEVSDSIIEDRIVNRRIHPGSGRVYNLKSMPPKIEGLDDVTGEPLIHRNDDKEGILKQRLQNYHELTEPIIPFLKSSGLTIIKINAETNILEQVDFVKSKVNESKRKSKP